MEYVNLEKLGVRPSRLGFGCMRFPTTPEGTIDEPRAMAMLDTAYRAGVNYFDTAYFYHNRTAEAFLGRALKMFPRESFKLATKLPVSLIDSLEKAKEIYEGQFVSLDTPYFDFYLLHALDGERWDAVLRMGILDFLLEEQKKGRIRHLGFSFHDDYAAFERILTYRDWDFCQIQFNYLDTDIQAGERGYALAEQLGVPLVIMEPVKGGALADLPEDLAARLRRARPGASMASWALRWAAGRANVLTVLSGMSTLEQVEDNAATFTRFQPLTQAELALVEETAAALRARVKNGCTGCRYCMPCPAGVDIPKSFRIWNRMAMYQNYPVTRRDWKGMEAEARPDQCYRCGRCERLCPQHLPIRAQLAQAHAEITAFTEKR